MQKLGNGPLRMGLNPKTLILNPKTLKSKAADFCWAVHLAGFR